MADTPMMRQYQEAKTACPDALLLFRMGDFYELFFDDARTAARLLGLALTSRDKSENAIPMAGFPHHQLESYLRKLVSLGMRVAICEQMEDPRQAKGLVKRDITRVVTPGTLTDDALLDPRESNYLAAVVLASESDDSAGLAWVELSTGRFPRGGLSAITTGRSVGPHRPGGMPDRRASGNRLPGKITRDEAPGLGLLLGHRHSDLIQALRHGHAGRFWFRRRSRCPGAASRRRRSRLSHRNTEILAGASRSIAAVSHWLDFGNRRIDAPQPGDIPDAARRPARRIAAVDLGPHANRDGLATVGRLGGQSAG